MDASSTSSSDAPMSAPIEDPIPAGLVKVDAPDTLHGYKLVEEGSEEHLAMTKRKGKPERQQAAS